MTKIMWEVILPLPEDRWQEPLIRASVQHGEHLVYAQYAMRQGYSREDVFEVIYEMQRAIGRHCAEITKNKHAELQEEAARSTRWPVSTVLTTH